MATWNAPASPADPRSFLQALGTRPAPSLLDHARHNLARIDSALATRLSSLHSSLPPSDPLLLPLWSASQAEAEVKAREEAEKEKLPYKSVISLFELQQIYEGLANSNDSRITKTLEVLNSFTEHNHVSEESQLGIAKLLLETAEQRHDKLDLSGRSLYSLPASFGGISALVSLDLSKNQLKVLPSSLADLNNLEILDVHSNQLSMLPDAIGFLDRLKVLNVSGNMLLALPDSIGGCRALVELKAGFNQLERLPAKLGYDLLFLENLTVHSNKLTFLPASICELRRLKILDLHFNSLKSLPTALGNLLALEKLNLSNNFSDFGGRLPDSIGDLAFLVELDLSFNQIRVLPDSIGALENLKVLKVENNPLIIPPMEVVEHSPEALIEYMGVRWKSSLDFEEDMSSSPRAGERKIGRKTACVRVRGSWLVNLMAGKCGGRHSSVYSTVQATGRELEWHNRTDGRSLE